MHPNIDTKKTWCLFFFLITCTIVITLTQVKLDLVFGQNSVFVVSVFDAKTRFIFFFLNLTVTVDTVYLNHTVFLLLMQSELL